MHIKNGIQFPSGFKGKKQETKPERKTEMVEGQPRYILHNTGEMGSVSEYLGNGKYKTRKIYHMSEAGVMCIDLETFIPWEKF